MANHFLAYMYRLQHIERWSLMRSANPENVAEHSFHVALIAHSLGVIAREIFGRDVQPEQLASYALFHDATEVFTGDIPTPVKHQNPRILANFREIEAMASERLLANVPERLRGSYAPLFTRQPDDPALAKLLKAADLLDAYLKCTSEMSAGNREFATARRQIEEKLAQLGLPEVEWFLDHLAPGFERTIDELSETEGDDQPS
ncbi:5'-deoxynucleotidase [Cohnella sp. CIP 111063]|jgi:5'-deoxynucleotidase|uniref:5'-deoxynucleotidase n=1 Tax=unclassified Cohnella TaxID=2636738 RepID=UPI000B8C53A9|nr:MULTISPECIES: 5'-deoxynucleotidase [unclassified Cohnella]OXS62784.1 5'-deoxynucleotidase [Cohnella sp. CIP 111063]PRX75065.1 5'-deoxynucleotidase [Cohnella sp. SGD-V74]